MTTTAKTKTRRTEKEAVRTAASGRWLDILRNVGGIPSDILDGSREHPCPKCGGDTRFRLIDESAGAVRCSHCFAEKCGDGFAAIGWMIGCSFPQAVGKVSEYLGMGAATNGRAKLFGGDVFGEVCREKRMPIESAKSFGGKANKWGNDALVEFPVYDASGEQCGKFAIRPGGEKGKFAKGSKQGLFLPHSDGKVRLPRPEEKWILVEGVKDAAALHDLGYQAAGLPTRSMNKKFASLFKGVDVIIVPDLDKAGREGAANTAANLHGVAKTIRMVDLPGEKGADGGEDVRDVLALSGGQSQLRQAIAESCKIHEEEEATEPCAKFSFGELLEQFPTLNPPIVDGLFRRGETVNIIASPKVGKSWMAYDLSLAIIAGQNWLGKFPTARGKVLLVDNELHASTLANRLPRVAEAKEMFPSDYADDLHVWPLRGRLKSIDDLSSELEEVEPGQYQAIILDAKYRFVADGDNENDNAAQAIFYNTIDRIAEQTKAAIVMVHHSSKGDQAGKRVTDVGAGAGAQSRAADCHLVLREHETEGVFVLAGAVRSFAPVEPLALRWKFPLWSPALDVDPRDLAGIKTKNEQRQTANDREGMESIINALAEGAATARQLREKSAIGKDRLARLLNLMVFEEQISAAQVTIKGNECNEYHLPKEEF